MDTHDRSERGFTLVELMMSLVIFSVAVAGILAVAVSLTQGFREQRQAINAQDAVRGPLDLMSDALRQVSPGVLTPSLLKDVNACTTGALTVTAGTSSTSDAIDIVYASGGVVTTATATTVDGSVAGTTAVIDATGFAVGDLVLFTNSTNTEGFAVKLTSVSGSTIGWAASTCSSTFNTGISYTGPVLAIRVQHATFSVANDASNNNMPTLWMDPDGPAAGTASPGEPLAEAIEDLQVVLIGDVNSNGIIDAEPSTKTTTDDYVYNVSGDSLGSVVPRAIRLTLIARTTAFEHGNQNTYAMPTSEDRTTASAADQYRRRILKTVVDLRNISGSPGT